MSVSRSQSVPSKDKDNVSIASNASLYDATTVSAASPWSKTSSELHKSEMLKIPKVSQPGNGSNGYGFVNLKPAYFDMKK